MDRETRSAADVCTRFIPAIRLFARRRLRTADAVDEFVQDVLLIVVEAQRRGSVEDPARLGGYVLGVCKNLARDRARARDRRNELWEKFGADLIPLEADAPSFESDDVLRLEDCISGLSLRARTVIQLSYFDLASHQQIAAKLEVSEANARVMRHRTLQALRECMAQPSVWDVAQ